MINKWTNIYASTFGFECSIVVLPSATNDWGLFQFSYSFSAMEQTPSHKKQTVTMEAIESAITSHRSLVSTWLEKSGRAEKSSSTKYNIHPQNYPSPHNTVEQSKHTGQADHQRAYSRLGIGAKPGATSGTSDSLQVQRLKERMMKQSNNSSHRSPPQERSFVVDKLDEMESRNKAVGQSKKRRL